MIGILVLAAGSSSRLGRPKQLLPYRGQTLLQHAVEAAVNSTLQPVVVVLGAGADELRPALVAYPVEVALNLDWEGGMGGSLRVGMETLLAGGRDPEAVVVILCDQPFVVEAIPCGLAAAFRRTACPVVACEYGATVGVPALFSRAIFPELLALEGTRGAQSIISRDPARVHHVVFPPGAVDIDTVEDYERLIKDNSDKSGYSSQHRR